MEDDRSSVNTHVEWDALEAAFLLLFAWLPGCLVASTGKEEYCSKESSGWRVPSPFQLMLEVCCASRRVALAWSDTRTDSHHRPLTHQLVLQTRT